VLADVDLGGLVDLQIMTTCVHWAGDLVLAAEKESMAAVVWGDCQVGSYRQRRRRQVEASVRLFGVLDMSVDVPGLMLEMLFSKTVAWTLVALFVK
jgi:hypothetical protein